MLLNANNRQRYCVRVSINVSLFLLNMQCGRGWYLQPQGRGSMGVTLWFKWAWSNSWQSNVDADFWASVCYIKSVLYALGFNAFFVPKNMCKILGLNKQWL